MRISTAKRAFNSPLLPKQKTFFTLLRPIRQTHFQRPMPKRGSNPDAHDSWLATTIKDSNCLWTNKRRYPILHLQTSIMYCKSMVTTCASFLLIVRHLLGFTWGNLGRPAVANLTTCPAFRRLPCSSHLLGGPLKKPFPCCCWCLAPLYNALLLGVSDGLGNRLREVRELHVCFLSAALLSQPWPSAFCKFQISHALTVRSGCSFSHGGSPLQRPWLTRVQLRPRVSQLKPRVAMWKTAVPASLSSCCPFGARGVPTHPAGSS